MVGLNLSSENVSDIANQIYKSLWSENIETLFDDRTDAAAGVKLNDADLLGIPIRVIVSPRNLDNEVVEIKYRKDSESYLIPIDSLVPHVKTVLNSLKC